MDIKELSLKLIDLIFEEYGQSKYASKFEVKMVDILRVPLNKSILSYLREPSVNAVQDVKRQSFDSLSVRLKVLFYDLYNRMVLRGLSKERILFYSEEPTHIEVQMPIAVTLLRSGFKCQFFTDKSSIYEILKSEGFTVSKLRQYPGIKSKLVLESEIEIFLNYLSKDSIQIQQKCSLLTQKYDFTNFSSYLVNDLNKLRLKVFSIAEWMKIMNGYSNPELMIIGNDLTLSGRAMAYLMKDYGVRTMSIMHGSVSSDPLHFYHVVDHFLTFGESSANELAEKSIEKVNFHNTGAPHYDRILKDRELLLIDKSTSSIPNEPIEVLIATSGPGHSVSLAHHFGILRTLVTLVNTCQNVKFIIKLHRKDKRSYYTELEALTNVQIIDSTSSGLPAQKIDYWIQKCAFVISGASTVVFESMLLNKPVIVLDLNQEFTKYEFIKNGIVPCADSPQQLIELSEKLLNTDEYPEILLTIQRDYISKHYQLDGNASNRAVGVIAEILRNSTKL